MNPLPTSPPVWQDEFDQPVGTGPDPARWVHDLGASGWGNQELQTYTDTRENSCVVAHPDASGGRALLLKAVRTPAGGYTSARLHTQGGFSLRHGRAYRQGLIRWSGGLTPPAFLNGAHGAPLQFTAKPGLECWHPVC